MNTKDFAINQVSKTDKAPPRPPTPHLNPDYHVTVVRTPAAARQPILRHERPWSFDDAQLLAAKRAKVACWRWYYTVGVVTVTIITAIFSGVQSLRPVPDNFGLDDDIPHLSTSLAAIDTTHTRARVIGYDRSAFGQGWQPAKEGLPCTVREIAIAKQISGNLECAPTSPMMFDPYNFSYVDIAQPGRRVEVDHIFPLAAAWDHGAHSWDNATRLRFANDPLNLAVVASATNQTKSDQLPSEWMPPQSGCWYSRRLAHVAATYGLSLTSADVATMRRSCLYVFG